MAPVYHGLYTNAFGRRGEGFRHLFLAPEWPPADRQRVGRWLETLVPRTPAEADGEHVAVNSFRIGPTIHACLARVDAEFARDEHGRRGGALVHALFVPLEEGRPTGSFTGELLALSRGFVRPETGDEDRLEAYLDQCREVREVTVPAVSPVFGGLGDDFLERFCAFASGPPRSRDAVFAPADVMLADALAAAAAALPPRLRLACRWAVGLHPTQEMSFVARTAGAGESLPPLPAGPGSVYARWLRDHGVGPAESWEIRSWDGLTEWMRRRGS
jgi:hypothetical protein